MPAVLMTRAAGLEHVKLGTAPVPTPADDEVLIRVATVAVNRQDLNLIMGKTPSRDLPLPHVLGLDAAGVVAAMGSAVDGFKTGDRVMVKPPIACGECSPCLAGEDDACERISSVGVHRPGGMASYVAVPSRNVFAIPPALGFAEATAVSHTFPVALTLLRKVGLQADDTVLVSGASGAVGNAVVQSARALGARAIAAVGSERGAARLRELPAAVAPELIIDYAVDPTFAPQVKASEPAGASIYVETASEPAVWGEALKALARRARVAVIGSHAGPIVEMNNNWLFRQRVTIYGCSGSSLAAYADALDLAAEGRVVPNIDSVLPMNEAVQAYQRLMDRQNTGKIVLRVTDDIG
jgi:acryloyl-coenzyme A reductase